jgi:hypothetical protein
MIRLLAALFALLFTTTAAAQDNYGFELGNLTGWTASNNATRGPTGWGANGVGVAVVTGVTNFAPGGGKTWNVTPHGTHMASLQAGSGAPGFDSIISSLGLLQADNTALRTMLQQQAQTGGGNPTPTNGVWLRRSVTLQAGVTYSIAWQYISSDYTPFNDGSLITLVHSTDASKIPTLNNLQRRYGLLGFTNPGTGNYSTGSYGSTGWQVATFTVPETGTYTLGFASFNLGDTALSPILLVDEIQGMTTLNGQTFAPVQPNAGSSAPPPPAPAPSLCCGGSATPFNANTAFTSRVQTFTTTGDSRVTIQQVGNSNTANVTQLGTRNFTEYRVTGSNNTATITQNTNNSTNYIEATIQGSNNSTTINQSGTAGSRGVLANVANNGNTINVQQQNTGSHYAEINLLGGNKTVNLTQSGSGNHMARIELSGGSTSITATQSGSTQQHYSITHSCAAASCAAITVTQGQ